MGLIGRMGRIVPLGLRAAVLGAGAVETLGEAAFFEEVPLQGFELAIEEVVSVAWASRP